MNCQDDTVCPAAASAAQELQVPLVGAISGLKAPPVTDTQWVFRVRPDYARETSVLGKQLLSMACSRIVVVTDAPNSELVVVMRHSLLQEGLTATVLPVAPTKTSTDAMMLALGKASYHAAVLVLSLPTLEWLMDNQVSVRPQWPRVIASVSSNHLQTLLAGFKNHPFGFTSVVPNPEIQDRVLTQEFQRTMDTYGAGHSSTYLGMEAYINAKLLVEALKRAPRPEPKAVAISLQAIDKINLGGFQVSFTGNRASGSSWVDIGVRSRDGHLLH
jgi:ABC-type branched-subunit amino acid transport system substrate-binding protein